MMARGQFDQKEYVKEYQRENRIAKKVTFNRKNPDDMAMVEWLDHRPEGIVQYLKSLIRDDMMATQARADMEERTEQDLRELSGLAIPAQHGYRDDEAIRVFEKEGHRLLVHRQGHWEARIDVDAKKVLTVVDLYKYRID